MAYKKRNSNRRTTVKRGVSSTTAINMLTRANAVRSNNGAKKITSMIKAAQRKKDPKLVSALKSVQRKKRAEYPKDKGASFLGFKL